MSLLPRSLFTTAIENTSRCRERADPGATPRATRSVARMLSQAKGTLSDPSIQTAAQGIAFLAFRSWRTWSVATSKKTTKATPIAC